MQYTVLVVDDEEGIRESLKDILEDEGYEVITASTAEEALKAVNDNAPDLVYLDIWLPDRDGIEVLEEIKGRERTMPVVMISGHGSIELAVKATKLGAYDFLEKPLSLDRVLLTAQRAIERGNLEKNYNILKSKLSDRYQLVGQSEAIKRLKEEIEMV